ncbi:hypothetical protein GGH13_000921 [Coemansia sp. S155-1]|nr:hypothetical protein GGH13_000921 [Coemansia sp. S155-1]
MTTTMSDDGQPNIDRRGQPIVDITKQHVIDGLSTVLKAYVEACAVVWPLLSGFYSKTLTKHLESKHKIHKDERHVARSYPLHRKQRLSAYINQQQANYRLARNMRTAFGKDADYRDRFKRFGFLVYLINEFRTSCVCPERDKSLETFKTVRNPRPFRRKNHPTVTCNGLLRCTNQECLWTVDKYKGSSERRLFNRNEAAVMNFRRIVDSLCETGDIPQALKRSTPRPTCTVASKRAATTGRKAPSKRSPRNGTS